jgi:serralysin
MISLRLGGGNMPSVFASSANGGIYSIASDSRVATLLGVTSSPMFDLAMRADGTLFGTDGSSLFTLSLGSSSLTTTRIGAAGTLPSFNALEFDSTGTLYGLGGSTLYRINTTTGVATSVGGIGGNSAGDLFFLGGTVYASTLAGDLVRGTLTGIAAGGSTQVVQSLGSAQVFGLAALTDRVLSLSGDDISRIDQSTYQPVPYANNVIPSQFFGATVEAGANASLQASPTLAIGTTAAVAASSLRIARLGEVGDSGIYRVDLNGLATGQIRSVTILDDGLISGGTGAASGIDVDFINLSNVLTSSASTAAGLAPSPALSFTADRVSLQSGFLQPWSSGDAADWNRSILFGNTASGGINLATATLSVRDGANPTEAGSVSLGEGGRLSIQLVSPISGGYLYLGDVGGGNDGFALLLADSATTNSATAAFVLKGTSAADIILLGQGRYTNLGGGADYLDGDAGNDQLAGSAGEDHLVGGSGNDILNGGAGNDFLDGGTGTDTAIFDIAPGAFRIRDIGGQLLVDTGGTAGVDRMVSIEVIGTTDGLVTLQADFSGLFRQSLAGDSFMLLGSAYAGPVTTLQRQLFGTSANEVLGGTSSNDFLNLFAGDDAANAGTGNDVIDGGLGSNFLTGGAGTDTFFSDGRGGGVTWTTIVDWAAGEQLSVWGWRPGTSRVTWVDSDGVGNFKGVTMHGDLNGDGVFDTSVTWSGMTRAGLPTPLEFDGLLWFIG